MPALPYPLSPEWLKAVFCIGVDATDEDGEEFPREQALMSLSAAAAGIGALLNLDLQGLSTYTGEMHDAVPTDRGSFFLKRLRHRPVREILKVALRYGNWPEVELPVGADGWVHIRNENSGRIEIIPGPTALTGSGAAVPYIMGFLGTQMEREWRTTRMPGWLRVTYTAGYDGTTYPLPDDILQAIGLRAAKPILISAGDLILGPGIANESLSFGGLSQSIGSTASAENNAYSAQIKENQKQYDEILSDLKARYRAVSVIGL